MAETFAQIGRVEAIRQLFEGSGYTPFEEPLSFECSQGEHAVTASNMMLEGVDFDLVYFPLKHLGYKSVISVTGELYAAMAAPRTLSLRLGLSAKLDFDQVKDIWSGVLAAAKEHGYSQVSLDLQPSRNGLSIAVGACGIASKESYDKRPNAQSKDLICVSGRLGAAYFGLQLLEREKMKFEQGSTEQKSLEQNKMQVAAYLKPELAAGVLGQLAESEVTPTFSYFITKGLADSVLRLVRDSSLGAKIYADKIPFEGGSFALGQEFDIDPLSAAMNGGDDYQLLFTIPIAQYDRFRKDFQTFSIIGHLAQSDVGAVLVTPEGIEHKISAQGWNL